MNKGTQSVTTDPINRIQHRINKMFDDLSAIKWFEDQGIKDVEVFTPKADIVEKEDSYHITIDLPGIPKNEIKLSLKGNCLSVSGERESLTEKKEKEYHRQELRYGNFYRSFTLPNIGSAAEINATLKDGILTINIPKSEESKPKEIKIK